MGGLVACAVASSILAFSANALAYPIAAKPLWEVIRDSELIVVATVDSVEPSRVDLEAHPFDQDTAKLSVLQTWKGTSSTGLAVHFSQNVTCPAPPRYAVGETVLAFLQKRGDAWTTTALSYGTLYPGRDELPIFHDRVREALALQERVVPRIVLNFRRTFRKVFARYDLMLLCATVPRSLHPRC